MGRRGWHTRLERLERELAVLRGWHRMRMRACPMVAPELYDAFLPTFPTPGHGKSVLGLAPHNAR